MKLNAEFAEIKQTVNQVETHVFQQQKIAKEYRKKNGTQIESWEPFAEGKMITLIILSSKQSVRVTTNLRRRLLYAFSFREACSSLIMIPKQLNGL